MKLTKQLFFLALSGILFSAPYAIAVDESIETEEERFELTATQSTSLPEESYNSDEDFTDFPMPSEEELQLAAKGLSEMSPEDLQEIGNVLTQMLQEPEAKSAE